MSGSVFLYMCVFPNAPKATKGPARRYDAATHAGLSAVFKDICLSYTTLECSS